MALPFGPPLPDAFWNALMLLDAVTVMLLRRDPRGGVATAAAVMIADVAADVYTWQVLSFDWFAIRVAMQAAFLGFILGAAPLIWISAATGRRPPTD